MCFCGSPKTETDRIITWLFDRQKADAAISKASGEDSLAIQEAIFSNMTLIPYIYYGSLTRLIHC